MPGMLFTLTGRDELSDVFDDAGDAARRLHRRISAATTEADRELRRLGRTTATTMAGLRRDSDAGGKALDELGKVTRMLWPAAIPAVASLAPIAAGAGTVAVAVTAMTAAMIPQIAALSEASEAQKAYEDAVDKSGATSQEAVQAQAEYARAVAKLPPATREAAAAVGVLKDSYKEWSNSLADDTMAPFTKGVTLVNSLLPRTTGLVKAASAGADRFVTIIGGAMASPGLDRLNQTFTGFAEKTIRKVNDELVHLMRVSDSGEVGGPAREFMTWARAQGPAVASVLSSVASSLVHVLQAGSEVGVGLLQIVEVLARLVSAVPASAIALFLQLALALKLTKVAALGMAAARTALAGFGVSLVAMNTAAAAAPGRLAAVRAAISALSRTTKLALAGTGIGLLVIALSELSQRGRQAPPDVDKLTGSLKQLGATGKVTGEAAQHFGSDLSDLHSKVRALTDPSTADKVQQFLVGWTGWDSTPVKDAKENIDAIDKSLASLVQSGDADLAAAALKRMTAAYGEDSPKVKAFTDELGDYKSALADAKFESQLAADAQGLFGQQALAVQEKLERQKLSADGLRQSIAALNETSRSAFDAETKFEAAIDNVTKALQANGRTLDAGTEKGRANRDALSQLGAATEDAAAKARENGSSWETVTRIYDRGRSRIIASAQAMGMTRAEAKALADQILRTPNKTAKLRGDMEDLQRKLDSAKAKLKSVPDSRRAQVRAEISQLERQIASARSQLNGLNGKTATTYIVTHYKVQGATGETRNLNKLRPGHYASGGSPEAGEVAMVGENGPELVMFGEAARVFDATTTRSLMSGTVSAAKAATDGLVGGLQSSTGVYAAARTMAAAVTQGIRDELEIRSPSKKTAALAKDVGRGFISGLTGSREKIQAVAKDLATDIRTAFSGRKESNLLKYVDKQTDRLLAAAKKRDAVAAKIAEAKKFATDTASAAASSAGLSNLGMDAEEVTAGGIKAGLASKLAQIKQFTRYIDILAKRGLSKNLLRQILNMGPEAGYAYASALAGADKMTFSQINRMQSQISASSTSLGRLGADSLYDAGKNAGKGFLKGLEGQQKDIEKLMLSIAKSMQKSIKKALGIRSPSRVMASLGAYSTQGLAAGLVEGLPHVDRAMDVVAGRMAGKAIGTPVAGRPAVAAAGGGVVYQVHVEVKDAMDPVAVGRELQRVILQLGRAQGATVSLNLGGV